MFENKKMWGISEYLKVKKTRSIVKKNEQQFWIMKMFLAIFDQLNVEKRPKKVSNVEKF